MDARLTKKNGRMVFCINGEIVDPTGFMTYNPYAGQFKKFRELGSKIFFFGAYACDQGINNLAGLRPFTPHFYVGENQYDFSEIERTLEDLVPEGEGVYIIPRVYLSTPRWWDESHPEDLPRNRRGEAGRDCFSSSKWREDMWGALKALMDYINASKWRECVIGYHIAAGSTEEWTYHGREMGMGDYDYSLPNQQYFRNWLSRKYNGSIAALNTAWNKAFSGFEQACLPSVTQRHWSYNGILRDPRREQNVLDYYEYSSWLFSDTILYFCRKVKEYSNNTLLTGAFYGYVLQNPKADKNHNALYDLICSPYIDFLATTHGGGVPWPYATAVDSIRLHDKLFVSEGDIRTCLTQLIGKTMPHILPDNNYYSRPNIWLGPDSLKTSVANLKRSSARGLTGMTGIWWFDMFGGWFDDPELMQVIRKHDDLIREQTFDPIRPEVALIVDEDGLKYFPKGINEIYDACDRQRVEMSLCGAPYHIYLADDLADDRFPADDYKCYIFVQFCNPAPHIVQAIETKLKGGGRTLFWTHFAGLNHPKLTDFQVTYDPFSPKMQCDMPDVNFPTFRTFYEFRDPEQAAFPPKGAVCPRFAEQEKYQCYSLANFKDTNEPALLWKQFDDYASVYSLVPGVPYQVLQEIIAKSNAHVYSRTGDVLMAGGNYVAIRSMFAGEKRIHFPFPVSKVVDVYTGEEMAINEIYIDFEMTEDETRIFRMTKK